MSHTLVSDMTYFSVPDFEENRFMIFSRFFPDFEENRFLIYKKIVSDFFTILFRFWRKSFFDFGENRFLIFSWFLQTRFIKLICIRKNTEKIVCKSRDFNTILSTIYSTNFLVWVTGECARWPGRFDIVNVFGMGGMGVLPQKIFTLNGVKTCNSRQE